MYNIIMLLLKGLIVVVGIAAVTQLAKGAIKIAAYAVIVILAAYFVYPHIRSFIPESEALNAIDSGWNTVNGIVDEVKLFMSNSKTEIH